MTYKDNTKLEVRETPFGPKHWATLEDRAKREMVNHPKHYDKGNPAYEPYKVIGEWRCNFNIGNAIKYLARYKSKWNPIEDLEKAKVYIDFEIESLKSKAGDKPECPDGHEPQENFHENEAAGDLGQTSQETPSAEKIHLGEKVIDEANKALDEGASRVDIMRNILKMSDEEIDETLNMCKNNVSYSEIAKKIADAVTRSTNGRGMYFTRF